jgi:hypothetical protein
VINTGDEEIEKFTIVFEMKVYVGMLVAEAQMHSWKVNLDFVQTCCV